MSVCQRCQASSVESGITYCPRLRLLGLLIIRHLLTPLSYDSILHLHAPHVEPLGDLLVGRREQHVRERQASITYSVFRQP